MDKPDKGSARDDPTHNAWLTAQVQAAIDDPRPGIAHHMVMAEVQALIDKKRTEGRALMEKTKRNIADALATPGIADIDVEFPHSRELPRIVDLSDDAESDGEQADVANGITPANPQRDADFEPAVGRERFIPCDPADDLTSE